MVGQLPKNLDRYRTFLRGIFCLNCGAVGNLDPAHIKKGSPPGMRDHDYIVPLCRSCHQKQHEQGEVIFWSKIKFGRSLSALIMTSEESGASVADNHCRGIRAVATYLKAAFEHKNCGERERRKKSFKQAWRQNAKLYKNVS